MFAASRAAIRKHPAELYERLLGELSRDAFPMAGMFMERRADGLHSLCSLTRFATAGPWAAVPCRGRLSSACGCSAQAVEEDLPVQRWRGPLRAARGVYPVGGGDGGGGGWGGRAGWWGGACRRQRHSGSGNVESEASTARGDATTTTVAAGARRQGGRRRRRRSRRRRQQAKIRRLAKSSASNFFHAAARLPSWWWPGVGVLLQVLATSSLLFCLT